jgi:hypothetical protein
MSLSCLFLRRRFVPYLQGELEPGAAKRLEWHLAACGRCAELLSRTRAGHEAGRLFGRLGPAAPDRLPSFEAIQAGRRGHKGPSPAVVLTAGLAAAAGLITIIVVAGRDTAAPARGGAAGAFTHLAIGDFGTRSRSRVVTEGFVRNVYYDEQEQTLHIKLTESPRGQVPFVICEVRDARGLTIPMAGSRVRVYGTARFDPQPGRGWHEVNPVMQIAVLNR